MTDKERLEEVVKNVVFLQCGLTGAPMSVELPEDDYWYLYEQAERAQELERKIERYREAIERALDESGWGDEWNALYRTIGILTKALEGERMNEFCPTCSGSGGIEVFDWSIGEVVTIPCPDCGGSEKDTDVARKTLEGSE